MWSVNCNGRKATIVLNGRIGEVGKGADDPTAARIGTALGKHAGVKEIDLKINSPGGNGYVALALHELLRKHGAAVTARVEGLAASAGSLVAMAAGKIVMPQNSRMYIHCPSTKVEGDGQTVRAALAELDAVTAQMAGIYAARTKQPRAKIDGMMAGAGTWMTPAEAKALGFADQVLAEEIVASLNGTRFTAEGQSFDLSEFDIDVSGLAGMERRAAAPAAPAAGKRAAKPKQGATLRDVRNSFESIPDRIAAATRAGNQAEVRRLGEVQAALRDFLLQQGEPRTVAERIAERAKGRLTLSPEQARQAIARMANLAGGR